MCIRDSPYTYWHSPAGSYASEPPTIGTPADSCRGNQGRPGLCRTCLLLGIHPAGLCARTPHSIRSPGWCVCEKHRCTGNCARNCGRRCTRPGLHWTLDDKVGVDSSDSRLCLCTEHDKLDRPPNLEDEGYSYSQCQECDIRPDLTQSELLHETVKRPGPETRGSSSSSRRNLSAEPPRRFRGYR